MRVPLDYYRILGLPIQATSDQLEQAHRDRTLQLPRREYSEFAVESRKQLIDEAYAVLSDPSQRQKYDTRFLSDGPATSRTSDSVNPTIDVEDAQVLGALLVLLELGEYELVIKLGRPYLNSGNSNLSNLGKPDVVLSDIGLTLALACLELGREQWQQNQYEDAAATLETGRELLVREDLLPALRAELQTDLYKLRPYRILELVARPLEDKPARQQGITLLKSMLQARGGIDGADDDLSGLNVEDFLRFAQQLRSYLTTAEQQDLFEAEARRPSAVGTYLAVYALLARGFAYHQPVLIRRAKQLLLQLSGRQDIHLEQAVCAVLLGQTEEASRALELSQEREPLQFIQQHSQGAPDLLPGLCLYSERWLQQEVFPFFRDLDQISASLKDYFSDEQVQTYLETMPPSELSNAAPAAPWASGVVAGAAGAVAAGAVLGQAVRTSGGETPAAETPDWLKDEAYGMAGQVAQLSPEGRLGAPEPGAEPPAHQNGAASGVLVPAPDNRRPRRRRGGPKWGRLILVALLGLLCLGAVGFVAMQLFGWLGGLLAPGPRLQGEPLSVDVSQSAIELPDTTAIDAASDAESVATTTIQAWFDAKAAALGKTHNTTPLGNILVEPALSRWQEESRRAENNGVAGEYTHELEVTSVSPDDLTANEITVKANVREKADFYIYGTLDSSASYDDQLSMEYTLVRQGDRWLIASFDQVN
ncbi:MAG: IMS domain-containing protein [Cyanobacteria bacterium J06632_22]